MRFLSLFSGVGGMDLGLHRAGMECVGQVELDDWRRGILERHWPEVPRWKDIREFAPADALHGPQRAGSNPVVREPGADERIDLICGGFPCQDLSVAGRRRGLAGERSGLFYEYARILESVRPRWVLIENVPGLLSSQGGRDFAIVLATLAELGYGVAWRVLDSRYFGVPQRRRRVFVVGHLGARSAAPFLPFLEGGDRNSQASGEAGAGVAYASLSGLGSGGPDDNDGQAGRIVSAPVLRSWDNATSDPGASRGAPLITHALTSEGHDASEDGTGRGTPLVAAPLSHGSNPNSNAAGRRREDDINLVAGPLGGGNDGIGRRTEEDPNLVYHENIGGNVAGADHARALRKGASKSYQFTQAAAAVRRLTPTECCRLQGFPDDWFGEPNEPPDSPRYAALGDAVTVPVAEWIGKRILEADRA